MTLVTALMVLLLMVLVFMAIRDGRAFFGDVLKVIAFALALLLAFLTWLPILRH